MIRVQLPGRFRMYDETRCLNEEAIHSPMITKLLVYMICNKNHIVTPVSYTHLTLPTTSIV